MTRSIAIDLGASSGRIMLGEMRQGRIIMEEIHRFENGPIQQNGHLQWDIIAIFSEIMIGLKKVADKGYKDHLTIGIASWGVDFALLDDDDRLIENPYHYRDAIQHDTTAMIESIGRQRLYEMVGIQFMEINTLNRLYQLTKDQPQLIERTKTILYISDLIVFMLTGTKVNEYTMASTSSLLDLNQGTYHEELLKTIGVRSDQFPDIKRPGFRAGELKPAVKALTGLTSCEVILIASHDTASAVLGTPLSAPNSAYLSSGTWSLLGALSKTPVVNHKALHYNFTNEAAFDGQVRFLKNISGLWLMQELKRDLDEQSNPLSFDELDVLIEQSPSPGVYIDPNDVLFAEPNDMMAKINHYLKETNQTPLQDIGAIGRCILESLALTTKKHFIELEDALDQTIEVLHVIGGGVKNKLLLSFTTEAVGKNVIAGPIEATAIGNIIAQQHYTSNLDIESFTSTIEQSVQLETITPTNTALWNNKYRDYLSVIHQKKEKVVIP